MKTCCRQFHLISLVVVATLAFAPAGKAQGWPPPTLVLTETNNGTTANGVAGQSIRVDLRGNASTGFAWSLASLNGDSVQTNGPATYTTDPGGGIGSGGTFSFPFLAVQPGDTALAFEYKRPWDTTPLQTFGVTLHVVAAPPQLALRLDHTNVIISWPMAGSTNFFLEGTTNLAPPRWAALNVQPLAQGTNYTVTLGAIGPGMYFRLHRL